MNVALMGSVSSSWHALRGLIRGGVEVTGVLGVDESRAVRISDYRSLREPAEAAGLPFLAFKKVTEPEVETFLRSHVPDMLWVIGLSQLVPDSLLSIARSGGVGFHPTLLPEGRGRAPVAWTILRDARAAVNLFYLAEEADAGDIIVQREVPVLPNDYSEDLIARQNVALEEMIVELAPRIRSGDVPRTPQDHSKATYYPKRTPADGLIDWKEPTEQIYRLIRAAGRPYPGAFTHADGAKITIWRAMPADDERGADELPGTVLHVANDGRALVATGTGALWLTQAETEMGDVAALQLRAGQRLA